MRLRILPLLLSACAALCADQVTLINGDTITGNIIKKDGAKLTLKSEFLGEVTVPWAAVKSLNSDQNLVVVLPGGESVAGKVVASGGQLEVAAPGGTKSAPLAAVQTLRNPAEQHAWERLQHPGPLQLWAGSFDLGLAMARGNARTDTLTTTFNATRVTSHDKIAVHFDQFYGTARIKGVTSTIASAVRGGWTYDRNLSPRVFLSTLNNYEHDGFQDLNLRFVAGAGLGFTAIKAEKVNLGILGGSDYERENFTSNLTRNSGEINFGDEFLYKISSASSVTQSFRMFPNLTNTGQYRVSFDLAAVTTIKKWLGWHVTASDHFLSNPVFGRQRNDLILATGLRVSFAK